MLVRYGTDATLEIWLTRLKLQLDSWMMKHDLNMQRLEEAVCAMSARGWTPTSSNRQSRPGAPSDGIVKDDNSDKERMLNVE